MTKEIDVYRDWLGIKEAARPLNHYQLLRLKQFEDNAAAIRSNYRKMNAHVRKYATGEFAAQSQALLNELAKAMLCLTDAQRKGEYDATLGRADKGGLRRRSFEEVLLANGTLDQAKLEKARNYAKAVGLEVRDAVIQQKLATPDVVMLAYAEAIGLPYVELEDVGVAEDVVPLIPPPTARQHSFVPIMADETQVLMASPNPLVPDVEEELRLRLGKTIRSVLCTPAAINEAVAKYYPRDAVAVAPVAAPKGAATKAAAPAKQAAAPKDVTPEEERKQQRLFAILGFNMTVIVTVVLLFLLKGGLYRMGWTDVILAAVVGVIGATVGYVLGPKFSS
ncbi:MAG: general secretion pathway protein GspE [Pirellulaceae bacterium]|nr:general secretion pathway protein GspE [Pirellulaceae bacterium]